jgi:hypothetical protein
VAVPALLTLVQAEWETGAVIVTYHMGQILFALGAAAQYLQ